MASEGRLRSGFEGQLCAMDGCRLPLTYEAGVYLHKDRTTGQMVLFCEGCPVRVACLEFALAAEDALDHRSAVSRHGWWGGLGPRERAALAAGRQRPAPVSAHGTEARYRRQGCRCEACRAAAALADRNRRARRRQAA